MRGAVVVVDLLRVYALLSINVIGNPEGRGKKEKKRKKKKSGILYIHRVSLF